MCGRYASYTPPSAIRALVRVTNVPNAAPSWNVAPSQQAMAMRRHPETGERPRSFDMGRKQGPRCGDNAHIPPGMERMNAPELVSTCPSKLDKPRPRTQVWRMSL